MSREAAEAEKAELMKQCRRYFVDMDRNKDGKLNRSEFSQMCREIGLRHDVSELKKSYDKIDKNGDGVVTFSEFMDAFSRNNALALASGSVRYFVQGFIIENL